MSIAHWKRTFHDAPDATLDLLVGEHRSELVGPWFVRLPAPLFLAVRGMPFWGGKRFDAAQGDELRGVNVLRLRGHTRDSIPITARLEDGDLVVRYPADSQWPWPNVVDRLRPLDGSTLVGLTFGLPLMPPEGLPFLLHRIS